MKGGEKKKMTNETIIKPRGTIDITTLKKVGIGCLIAIAGGILTYAESVAGMPDLGTIGTILQYAVNSGLVNLARKLLTKY